MSKQRDVVDLDNPKTLAKAMQDAYWLGVKDATGGHAVRIGRDVLQRVAAGMSWRIGYRNSLKRSYSTGRFVVDCMGTEDDR